MSSTALENLKTLIAKLKAERLAHEQAIARIDEAFASFGIQREIAQGARTASAKKRTLKKYKTTANELILSFVKAAGAKGLLSGQIDKHWKAAGRKGSVYNTLAKLVATKKLIRQKVAGQTAGLYKIR